jgi:hypothetical protein
MIPDKELEKEIWFKPERRLHIDNGALEVGVAEYSVMPPRPEGSEPPKEPGKAGKTPKAKTPPAK